MNFDFVIPGIVVSCYIAVEIAKKLFLKTDEARQLIPVVCAIIGVIICLVLYFIDPNIIGCYTILDAIAAGGLSGFAATGCNQLYKQIRKYKGEDNEV